MGIQAALLLPEQVAADLVRDLYQLAPTSDR